MAADASWFGDDTAIWPDEWTGLLVSDVDFSKQLIRSQTRFEGRDFNKGRQSFCISFPPHLEPLLRRCIGGRTEGPLLRSRSVFTASRRSRIEVHSFAELEGPTRSPSSRRSQGNDHFRTRRQGTLPATSATNGRDFPDTLGTEFKRLVVGDTRSITIRDLRSSISTEMNEAGMSHLALRYVTGHSTNDVLNSYVKVDVAEEMFKYFRHVQGLLEAIAQRSRDLGLDD